MSDLIERQAALNANYENYDWQDLERAIRDLPPVHAEPLSVIEDIKAEIKQKREENRNGEYDKIFELCLLIIDKHISGKESE